MKVQLHRHAQTIVLGLILTILLLCLFSLTSLAQTPTTVLTQTIRGKIVDKQIQSTLPGAIVTITDLHPVKGTSSDLEGRFRIQNVPVGRHTLKITMMGYEELVLNIDVNSGKENVLVIEMVEKITSTNEVVIMAEVDKEKPQNELSTVSSRTFSVEETQRFAAAVNDPARMAMSFAGVQAAGDGGNNIVIRGNAPNGLLWRMEGVEVPNPNHFSSVGTAGGAISILSAQLLTNSDFMTGAFAAEYGNALSGVFDLKLRHGNNEKREFTFQAGVLGFDFAAEGPLSRRHNGSYLINYRYSTLSLLSKANIIEDNGITNFQDLSFNIVLPTTKAGTFTAFGFGGLSSQNSTMERDSTKWIEPWMRYGYEYIGNTGVLGLTHRIGLGDKTFLHTALVVSGTGNGFNSVYILDNLNLRNDYEEHFNQQKLTLSSTLTHKFNAQHTLRTGLIVNRIGYDFNQKYYDEELSAMRIQLSDKGNTSSMQSYAQWQYRPSESITLNAGTHILYLALNNQASIEPRLGAKWNFLPKQTLSLGYGLHSQLQPLGVYFADIPIAENATTTQERNLNVGFSKAHHLVLGYDRSLEENVRMKVEVFNQWLFNIPVSADPISTYSTINTLEGFVTRELVNKGKGYNRGVELTLERFLNNNWYFMLSGSLYESKYKALDNIWRNTRFNGNYSGTFTAGREFVFDKKGKKRILGLNAKVMLTGGYYITPIDLAQSIAEGETVRDQTRPFSEKLPDYFRVDTRVSLRRDFPKFSSTVSLDLQNATNQKNLFDRYYDSKTGTIKDALQTPLIPVLSWRVQF
jgi:hypothetical protein